jgi:hypothetical protein
LGEGLQRPWWVTLTVNFLLIVLIGRLCVTADLSGQAFSLGIQMAHLAVLGLIIVGLLGMRRWAAFLLLLFCAWTMLAAGAIGAARLAEVGQIANYGDRDQITLTILRDMILAWIQYGLLGLLYLWAWPKFKATPPFHYRWIGLFILLSLLFLQTTVQIAAAPRNVELRQEALEQTRRTIGNFMGQDE